MPSASYQRRSRQTKDLAALRGTAVVPAQGLSASSGYRPTVQAGYHCEECEEAIFPATTRSELNWLRNRRHIVVEVAKHVSGGLDTWMVEGLDFLDKHEGHSVVISQRR